MARDKTLNLWKHGGNHREDGSETGQNRKHMANENNSTQCLLGTKQHGSLEPRKKFRT